MAGIIGIPGRLQSVQAAAFARNPRPTSSEYAVILLGLLIVLPMLGAQLGVNLSIVSRVIGVSTGAILDVILRLTGNV